MTPVEVAEILTHCTADPERLPRDPMTGLYVADGTVPPTFLTLPEYEAALRVLALRKKVRGL